jgi:hypothetical protein
MTGAIGALTLPWSWRFSALQSCDADGKIGFRHLANTASQDDNVIVALALRVGHLRAPRQNQNVAPFVAELQVVNAS